MRYVYKINIYIYICVCVRARARKLNKEIICMFKACRREIREKKEQPENKTRENGRKKNKSGGSVVHRVCIMNRVDYHPLYTLVNGPCITGPKVLVCVCVFLCAYFRLVWNLSILPDPVFMVLFSCAWPYPKFKTHKLDS